MLFHYSGRKFGIIVTVLNFINHFSLHPSEDIEYSFAPFKTPIFFLEELLGQVLSFSDYQLIC